jgi:hypothetical protein
MSDPVHSEILRLSVEERLAEHRRDPNSTITLEEVSAEARKAS